ncbi:hypothetical protein ACFOW4_01385 [Micromonospora sp. GCM10011542]|uniref:hypothetical protein n=1 Tax=Micromonospora sp. GCM10011542 TaxID=3317337 RepID=UPI00361A9D4C
MKYFIPRGGRRAATALRPGLARPLTRLGFTTFTVALGDEMAFGLDGWRPAAEVATYLRALLHEANSGDVYARARPA